MKLDSHVFRRPLKLTIMKLNGHVTRRPWNWTAMKLDVRMWTVLMKIDPWCQKIWKVPLKQPSTFTDPFTFGDSLFIRTFRFSDRPLLYGRFILQDGSGPSIFDHIFTSASFERPLYAWNERKLNISRPLSV